MSPALIQVLYKYLTEKLKNPPKNIEEQPISEHEFEIGIFKTRNVNVNNETSSFNKYNIIICVQGNVQTSRAY